MKKYLMMALICLMTAGCSKSDDGFNIDKTYADDDFTMTERNIKEKLVGNWVIDEMHVFDYDNTWVVKTAETMGAAANITIKADGSGYFLGLENPKWTISNNTITVSCLFAVGRKKDGSVAMETPIGTYYAITKQEAEDFINEFVKDAVISYEQMKCATIKVKSMEKDRFTLTDIDMPYSYRQFKSYGTIRRK